jgi:hypothetical protein
MSNSPRASERAITWYRSRLARFYRERQATNVAVALAGSTLSGVDPVSILQRAIAAELLEQRERKGERQ